MQKIIYSQEDQGYILADKGWTFPVADISEDGVVAAVLGAKIAENILPSPLKEKIRIAVDNILLDNNPDMLDTAIIDSLVISSGLQVKIDPELFNIVFYAWIKHHSLLIKYQDGKGNISERSIEPHVLAYLDYTWFVCGFCLTKNERRTFALHRILSAEDTGRTFVPDRKIIAEVNNGLPFNVVPIEKILIECDISLKHIVEGRPLHKDQKIVDCDDAKFRITLPATTDYELIHWILQQNGKARLIKPEFFKNRIAEQMRKIANLHSN